MQTLTESKAQWMKQLGSSWDQLMPCMALQPQIATALPHPTMEGRFLNLVEHSRDQIVGIDNQTGESNSVDPSDRFVYRLDEHRIAQRLKEVFRWEDTEARKTTIPYCFRLGKFRPLAGFEFDVYLNLVTNPYGRPSTISELAIEIADPFILIVPSHREIRERDLEWIRLRGSLILPLDLVFEENELEAWKLNVAGQDLLTRFSTEHLPSQTDDRDQVTDFFPTPAESRWNDVRMRLVDGETLSVSLRECRRLITYQQLGLANTRNAKPTMQWRLLEAYAHNSGRINWTSAGAAANVKKQTQLLSNQLQRYFRIPGRPIEFDKFSKAYQTQFHIGT